ncbi:MAG TPA: regulator, partial [Coriobacteriia bacterium]|nr:regulator [Coriobacteriia bacterium]
AVAIALIPWIASFAQLQIDNSLGAAGTNAATLTVAKLAGAGVVYDGMRNLGAGAILVGMVLAAILAYIIDRRWWWAAGWALFGAAMSFFGFMHASELGLNRAPGMELGYVGIAVTCALMYYYAKSKGIEPIIDDTSREDESAMPPAEPTGSAPADSTA